MRVSRILFLAGLGFILGFSSLAYPDVPQMINYQGKITTPAGALVDTTVQMIFTVYDDSTTGTVLWADTQSTVVVEKGVFSVLLGSGNPIPDSVFDGNIRYLGTKVGTDPEMSPRKSMVSVAYAYRAGTADGGPGGGGGWVDDGTLVRLETQTDTVGIGTATPNYRLHIEGSSTPPDPLVYVDQTGTGRGLWINTVGGACAMVTEAGNHGLRVISAGGDGIHVMQADGWAGYFNGKGYFGDNVGIRTTNPLTSLHVYKDTNAFVGISIENPNTESNSCEGIYFWNEDVGIAGIRLFDEGHASYPARMNIFNNRPDGSIHFGTAGQLSRMTVANDGKVGIGTTSPGADLDIVSANPNLRLSTASGTPVITLDKASGNWGYLEFREAGASKWQAGVSSSNDYYILNWPSSKYVFYANSAGNVGIGTTSPTQKLTIDGDIDMIKGQSRIHGVGEMSFDWSAGSTYDNPSQHGIESKDEAGSWSDDIRINSMNHLINTLDANDNDATSYFKVQHHSTGDGEDLFWVRSGDGYAYHKGRVGIGTTSPGVDLDILSANPNLRLSTTSGSPVITLDKASGYWSYLEFREGGASKWQAGVTSSNDYYILNWPSSKYVFYANSAGNVGIGTTSPGYKLDVNGDINVAGSYNVKKGGTNYSHPDYVFESGYDLMPIHELKEYVWERKCLPNVISAEDVKRNDGFKMDELLIQILEKIEEQTLYIFQLEERIAQLEREHK